MRLAAKIRLFRMMSHRFTVLLLHNKIHTGLATWMHRTTLNQFVRARNVCLTRGLMRKNQVKRVATILEETVKRAQTRGKKISGTRSAKSRKELRLRSLRRPEEVSKSLNSKRWNKRENIWHRSSASLLTLMRHTLAGKSFDSIIELASSSVWSIQSDQAAISLLRNVSNLNHTRKCGRARK